MKWMARVFVATIFAILAGCSIGRTSGYVDASAWSVNYTEDYIQDFWIQTADGRETGLEGIQVKEFSKGGTEPPRIWWRLQLLIEWSHEQVEQVFC